MKRYMRTTMIVLVLVAAVFILFNYWRYIFAKTVDGEIIGVERVTEPTTVIAGTMTPIMMYSFAIAVREDGTGKIFTASTEDRKWAIAKKGYCARVILYPYPPWQLGKSGEYHGARLEELRDCKALDGRVEEVGTGAIESAPGSQDAPQPAASPTP